jgi:hypothetical protein
MSLYICRYVDCRYTECHFTECRYVDRRYSKCLGVIHTALRQALFHRRTDFHVYFLVKIFHNLVKYSLALLGFGLATVLMVALLGLGGSVQRMVLSAQSGMEANWHHSSESPAWTKCYKTFYGRNLRFFVIS